MKVSGNGCCKLKHKEHIERLMNVENKQGNNIAAGMVVGAVHINDV